MPPKHSYLGKIFISHASIDKPFVQNLVTNLKNDGFEFWYDDNELLVGDKLEERIIQALDNSKLFIVVISSSSLNSRWLEFEMNYASKKLNSGINRIIPLLIEDVNVPSIISNFVYTKFTESFSYGYGKLLESLYKEAYIELLNQTFYTRIKYNLELSYGSTGYSSLPDTSGFSEIRYSTFTIDFNEKELDIVYEIVSKTYPNTPLNSIWMDEYLNQVVNKIDETFFLIVSERRISLQYEVDPDIDPHIIVKEFKRGMETVYLVFIDLSDSQDNEEHNRIIMESRKLLN